MTAIQSQTQPTPPTLREPPVVPGHFLLGNVRELQADRLGFLLRNLHAYGEVAQLRIFGRRIYAVYHPDGVKHVLQDNHTNYVKGPVFDPIRAIAGNSLFTPKASCGCANGASCSRPFTANGLLPSAR